MHDRSVAVQPDGARAAAMQVCWRVGLVLWVYLGGDGWMGAGGWGCTYCTWREGGLDGWVGGGGVLCGAEGNDKSGEEGEEEEGRLEMHSG